MVTQTVLVENCPNCPFVGSYEGGFTCYINSWIEDPTKGETRDFTDRDLVKREYHDSLRLPYDRPEWCQLNEYTIVLKGKKSTALPATQYEGDGYSK